ncbi:MULTISPECIES: hypothetical protein [unclassified Bradyrhizobium]|uniref:hypothetical protein n=1 Tax=unclassified Bradyrhizobium TaxID=2631580 RepID=UPI00291664B9|nr:MULTISPECIES: hypothetical protein [unclassified Bradyrhizobium]
MGALLALIVSITTLSWAWFSAARNEYKSSQSTEAADREKARLAVIRSNLQSFYIEGGSLLEKPVPQGASAEVIAQYTEEAGAWATKANTWIGTELGMAASARFVDRTAYPSRLMTGVDPAVSNAKMFIADLRQNLAKMIETNAWDAGGAK